MAPVSFVKGYGIAGEEPPHQSGDSFRSASQ